MQCNSVILQVELRKTRLHFGWRTHECSVTQCSYKSELTNIDCHRYTSDSNAFSIKLCDGTIRMALRLLLYH